MSRTRWAVEGPERTTIKLKGRKYSSNDDGAPMMCNLVCLEMGRHVHVDYCRTGDRMPPEDGTLCNVAEVEHIPARMFPHPNLPKDFVTHSLFWKRSGTFLYSTILCSNL
jgi:hypothetical protein